MSEVTPVAGSAQAQRVEAYLQIGRRLGAYRLVEHLATGGFGAVWRLRDDAGGEAALKVLHAELASSPELVERFQREAGAVRAIQHASVVELRDLGSLPDGRPYMIMELLSGVDLATRLRERGALPAAEAGAILRPLCEVLEVAHQRGIVHRDIKASNVFLCADLPPRVVLLDFGVAKFLEPSMAGLTGSRCSVGTPTSMAPEQIRGGNVDGRTDVYALGALLYEMLTGARPWAHASALSARYLHLHGRRPRPSELVPLDPRLDDVVVRAMAKEPSDRFASPEELWRAFDAACAPEATAAGCSRQPALGLWARVDADDDALDEADDALLEDLEAVVPTLGAALAGAGFRAAWEAGNAALWVAPVGPDGAAALVAQARRAHAELSRRPTRHVATRVRLCLGVGEVELAGDAAVAGPLLEVERWAPEHPELDFWLSPELAASTRGADVGA